MYFMIAIFTPDLKNLIDTKMSSVIHYLLVTSQLSFIIMITNT